MKTLATTFALAAVLAAGAASAQTLGEHVAAGKISPAAAQQLIGGTGLTAQEASSKTVNQIFHLRRSDD
jgi:hypothetical protein